MILGSLTGYQVMVYDDVKACHQPLLKRSSTQKLLVTKKMSAQDVLVGVYCVNSTVPITPLLVIEP